MQQTDFYFNQIVCDVLDNRFYFQLRIWRRPSISIRTRIVGTGVRVIPLVVPVSIQVYPHATIPVCFHPIFSPQPVVHVRVRVPRKIPHQKSSTRKPHRFMRIFSGTDWATEKSENSGSRVPGSRAINWPGLLFDLDCTIIIIR